VTTLTWEKVAHVDPPPALEGTTIVGPGAEEVSYARSLTFYLGPNHYPAGLYLPDGYDLESRPGNDLGWTILRARDSTSGQVLTLWAVRDYNEDGTPADGDQVKILDP
jgi:hypothetical protein